MKIDPRPVRLVLAIVFCSALTLNAPAESPAADVDLDAVIGSLELRSIGPAVMGGRIADLAVDLRRPSTWYAAVGSGGVWKTENAGTTWRPIFDDQGSYSIGVVTLDPNTPDTVWVGTGENVSGRHVGWGDGVYRSLDGGRNWQRMGLEDSEHIGDIAVDPRDSRVVYVAAEGPLWSSGGDRGLFKTSDGGASWTRILHVDNDTGVTDLAMDPRDPDVLYAATYQRRRTVWAHLAGGPGSGIHKSTDGGATWRRIEVGLPQGDMGKIGLAVSPADPDVVYATIEADDTEKGFYRSLDRGESWSRRSGYISNGTGPHYYQEIVASPHDVDRVYQMDVFLHVTRDGGAHFEILGDGRQKHSDNHALFIDPRDPDRLLAGTDGGLYETFDHGATWRHFGNMPISQFYKMALDNAEPFYNILGGAQDLGTLLGPSRTTSVEGVLNSDWSVPLGADGYACAFDPEKPDLVYLEWQRGRLHRFDQQTGELLDIQPQPAAGEPPERWNWDAPLVASSHATGRLYFGSHRVWRSDDRGNSWTSISGDLTHGRNRYDMPMIDRAPGVDALYDNNAMSLYATLTTLTESPRVDGLLYAGSDDGRVQVRDPADGAWRAAAVPPGVPEWSFVQDVRASEHHADTVFAAFDAHKQGDFRPLLFESTDRGRTWRSIAGDPENGGLPEDHIVWAVVQDHQVPDLLFAATEIGLFVTLDRGGRWHALDGGVPTIAFRDLEIQRRDNDLVGASFGRGFYVLDDYSPLRELALSSATPVATTLGATLFSVRDAWWYVPSVPMQAKGRPSQGSTAYASPNPPFGALFTYHLGESLESLAEQRRAQDSQLAEAGKDVPFPGWDRLREEALEATPRVFLQVSDAAGHPVRRLDAPGALGLHRVSWDLRWPPPDPVNLSVPDFVPPWAGDPKGPLVAPGRYRVELMRWTGDGTETLAGPQDFTVKPVPGATLAVDDPLAVAAFGRQTHELMRRAQGANAEIRRAENRIRHLERALVDTPRAQTEHFDRLATLTRDFELLKTRLSGDPVKRQLWEAQEPSILGRVTQVIWGHWDTRQAPTDTQRQSLEIATAAFESLGRELVDRLTALEAFEADLERLGAPWTPGRSFPE